MCNSNYKFAIVIINDGDITPGKATALTAEAFAKMITTGSDWSREEINWRKNSLNNIILNASCCDVLEIMTKCIDNDVRVLPVKETEFIGICHGEDHLDVIKRPIIKALAIGPDKSNKIDKITGNLRLYK